MPQIPGSCLHRDWPSLCSEERRKQSAEQNTVWEEEMAVALSHCAATQALVQRGGRRGGEAVPGSPQMNRTGAPAVCYGV